MIEVIFVLTGVGIVIPICMATGTILSKLREMQGEQRRANNAIMGYLEQKRNEPLLLKEGKKSYSLTVLGREIVKEENYDR